MATTAAAPTRQHSMRQPGCLQILGSLSAHSWPDVQEAFRTWEHDVQPDWMWLPRENPEVQLADALSKEGDPHDWQLSQAAFQQLCSQLLPAGERCALGTAAWGQPTVDLFASAASHQADVFVSRYPSPGAAAADAFSLSWTADGLAALGGGRKPLAFIFAGPACDPGRIIAKICQDRCPCILVVPRWHKYWRGQLVGPHRRDSLDLGFHDQLYQPGALVPSDMLARWQEGAMRYPLIAFRLDWTDLP
ncbi:hypothetical protein ABPG75_004237 [Micractinium tetrahymenae]